jgi:hypothetical protein
MTQAKKQTIARAVIAFLPFNESIFDAQLKYHYLSLAYVRTMQLENTKTDLIIFTPPNNEGYLKEIGCTTQQRTTFSDPERCIIITMNPLEVCLV